MDDIVNHLRWVSEKTLFFAPEAYVPQDERFELWHMPFLRTLDEDVSPIAAMVRLEKEGIWKGNVRMFLYWWWVHREMIDRPFPAETKKVLQDYINSA